MLIYLPSNTSKLNDGSTEIIRVEPRRHPWGGLADLAGRLSYVGMHDRGTVTTGLVKADWSVVGPTTQEDRAKRSTWIVRTFSLGINHLDFGDSLSAVKPPCFLSHEPSRSFYRYRIRVRPEVKTLRDLPMFEAYIRRSYWEYGELLRFGGLPIGPIEKMCADQFQIAESIAISPDTAITVTATPSHKAGQTPAGVLTIDELNGDGICDATLDLVAPLDASDRDLIQTASWLEGIPDEPTTKEHVITKVIARIEEVKSAIR